MKFTPMIKPMVLALGTFVLATFSGTATSEAHDRGDGEWRRHYHSHNHYRHHRNYYRSYNRYYVPREYVYYRGHRGYWSRRDGIQIFIRI